MRGMETQPITHQKDGSCHSNMDKFTEGYYDDIAEKANIWGTMMAWIGDEFMIIGSGCSIIVCIGVISSTLALCGTMCLRKKSELQELGVPRPFLFYAVQPIAYYNHY